MSTFVHRLKRLAYLFLWKSYMDALPRLASLAEPYNWRYQSQTLLRKSIVPDLCKGLVFSMLKWISAVVLKLYYETRKLKNSFEKVLVLLRFGSCQKLYELCESCHRNPGKTLKWNSFEHWQTIYLYLCCFGPVTWQSTLISNSRRLIQPYTTIKKLAFYIPWITHVTLPES